MKQLCFFILFALHYSVAQQSERLIEVQGVGELKTLPDLGNINIELSVVKMEFGESVRALNAKTEQLIAQLQTIGFKKEQIKTADFSVYKNVAYRNNYTKDSGFASRQNVTAEFPNTKEKIASIINSFMSSSNDVRFYFSFSLSDAKREQLKSEVLKLAINNAQSQAELIASAAKVQLDGVHKISYSLSQQIGPFNERVSAASFKSENNNSQGFDVKEITFSDTILMIWKIK